MYRENPDAAEVIGRDIGDIVDRSDNLTDDELRDELCDPYDLVLDILSGKAYWALLFFFTGTPDYWGDTIDTTVTPPYGHTHHVQSYSIIK